MSRKNKNFIDTYLEYTKFSEAPTQCHYWAAVSALAGAIRRQVWIDCGYWQWVPNFYIVIVAPPGIVSKSTTAGIAMELLAKVPKVTFGPSSVTWQKLVDKLAQSAQVFTTPAGQILSQSAMTCVASEFGTFIDPTNRDMVDILVDLWDSKKGDWTKSTMGGGDHIIKNPCLNVIGCTTPSWIASAFPEYMIGGGFTSRTVFVYADTKRQFVAYPGLQMGDSMVEVKKDLIADLTHISKLGGEMKLTPEAIELGSAWYEDFFRNLPPHLTTANFDGYIARKQTHIHKLAMILSIAETDDLMITARQLQLAIDKVSELEAMMPKVFGNIGMSVAGKKANVLLRFLSSHGDQSLEGLYALAQNLMGWEEFEKSVKDILQAKKATMAAKNGKPVLSLVR